MKYIYILILVVVIGGGYSCSGDFLDADSSNVITPGEMGDSRYKASLSFLNGGYVQLFAPDAQEKHDDYGYRAITLAGDMMSDDMAMPTQLTYGFGFDYKEENTAYSYRRPKSTWAQTYALVSATNNIFDAYANVDESTLSEDDLLLLGEAYGLRGIAYFTLINRFQQPYFKNSEAPGIPIYTQNINEPGRNTVSAVYDVIISDLNKSFELLKGKGMSSPGRINEYVVSGFLARVYSFKSDESDQWAKVAESAMYTAKGRNLFNATQLLDKSSFNSLDAVSGGEVIWGSYITNATTTFFASFFSSIDPYGPGYGGAAWEAYVQIASSLYDLIGDTDVRKKWWLAEDVTYDDRTIPALTQVKFVDRGGFTSDYVYMRSSEFYYLAAEAYYYNNQISEAQDALQTVMKTRDPQYNAYAYTGEALYNQIVLQKRIELWGEGVRLDDMKRRNTALNRKGNSNNYPGVIVQLSANPVKFVYQIPNTEIDNNPAIPEDENNPIE